MFWTIGALLVCLLTTSSTFGSSESPAYKPLHDEGRSSFTPTSTNTRQVISPQSSSSMMYAQNRDSFASSANVAQTYTVPAASQGGTAAAASSSYAAPATGGTQGGYQAPGQQSMTYYYYHYPAQQAQGGYGSYGPETTGYDDDGFDGASLGGLAGLLGLKGLKGLGGLGILALLKLLKKLFLPLFLPFLLLLPLLLLFIPIPVITLPVGGRTLDVSDGFGSFVTNRIYQTAQVAQDVLTSAMCVERLACEASARAHGTYLDKAITQLFEKTESMSSKKWKRAMRAYIDSGFRAEMSNGTATTDPDPKVRNNSPCSKYVCDLYKEVTSRLGSKTTNSTAPPLLESVGNEVPT